MNDTLKLFLSEWLAWAEADAPDHEVFSRRFGLCSNLDFWLKSHKITGQLTRDAANMISDEFESILEREFEDDCTYPFGGPEIYVSDAIKCRHHTNEKRLSWVRKQLGK